MTNAVAQTCSVPIRKMQLLAGELQLLKGAIEQMSGRLELLLAEIAELQLEHGVAREEREREIQPNLTGDAEAELLPADPPHSTMPSRVAPAVDASGQEMCVTDLAPDEPLAPISADAPPIPMSVAETLQPAAQTCDEIAIKEVTALAAAPPASELSHNIVVPDERRTVPARNLRRPLRPASRWAAAVALLAISLVLAADGTGFAAGLRELLSFEASCVEGPQVCGPFGGLPY